MKHSTSADRRAFLKTGLVLTTGSILTDTVSASSKPYQKTLSLYNIHTGEHCRATFWENGIWIDEEIKRINHLLRDHRTGESASMDLRLFNLMYDLNALFDANKPYHIISGYRSPKTNDYLFKHSRGVAKHSFHLDGKAVDVNLPGVRLTSLRKAAIRLERGGVGYYPRSNFIHIDTGRVRRW